MKEFDLVKRVIYDYGKKNGACADFLSTLTRAYSPNTLKRTLEIYTPWMKENLDVFDHTELEVSEYVNSDMVQRWFNSPFVSDFDKQQVLQKLGR